MPIQPNFEVNGLDWQCCLAGSSQRAPRIFIFSITMGADYSFYVKIIETHARAFFNVIIFSIGSVRKVVDQSQNTVCYYILEVFYRYQKKQKCTHLLNCKDYQAKKKNKHKMIQSTQLIEQLFFPIFQNIKLFSFCRIYQ